MRCGAVVGQYHGLYHVYWNLAAIRRAQPAGVPDKPEVAGGHAWAATVGCGVPRLEGHLGHVQRVRPGGASVAYAYAAAWVVLWEVLPPAWYSESPYPLAARAS